MSESAKDKVQSFVGSLPVGEVFYSWQAPAKKQRCEILGQMNCIVRLAQAGGPVYQKIFDPNLYEHESSSEYPPNAPGLCSACHYNTGCDIRRTYAANILPLQVAEYEMKIWGRCSCDALDEIFRNAHRPSA